MHIKLILDPAYVLCFSQTAVSDVRMDDKWVNWISLNWAIKIFIICIFEHKHGDLEVLPHSSFLLMSRQDKLCEIGSLRSHIMMN